MEMSSHVSVSPGGEQHSSEVKKKNLWQSHRRRWKHPASSRQLSWGITWRRWHGTCDEKHPVTCDSRGGDKVSHTHPVCVAWNSRGVMLFFHSLKLPRQTCTSVVVFDLMTLKSVDATAAAEDWIKLNTVNCRLQPVWLTEILMMWNPLRVRNRKKKTKKTPRLKCGQQVINPAWQTHRCAAKQHNPITSASRGMRSDAITIYDIKAGRL